MSEPKHGGNPKPIRVAGVVGDSIVDGPGLRLTVFVQGCPHRCAGCHNLEALDFEGGENWDAEELLALLDRNPLLSGVTLSGGEPLCQAQALLPFAEAVKARGKSLWCYTGYSLEALLARPADDPARRLLALLDVLVDGPYLQARRNLSLRFRGSDNQRLIDMPRTLATREIVLYPDESL